MIEWLIFLKNFGYFGIFLLSFLGASSIIIPIPYTAVLLMVAPFFNPIILALVSSFGAITGEFVGYCIGCVGRKIIHKKTQRRLAALNALFRKFGPVVIFIFALTPLPDDLIFIPLGLMRYSMLNAFLAGFLGKLFMSLALIYTGKIIWKVIVMDWYLIPIIAGAFVTIVILMFKIDWEKLARKYRVM